jgi:hypothetical protein
MDIQKIQVETLKRENDHLKEELVLETRQANQSSSMNSAAQISKLQVLSNNF